VESLRPCPPRRHTHEEDNHGQPGNFTRLSFAAQPTRAGLVAEPLFFRIVVRGSGVAALSVPFALAVMQSISRRPRRWAGPQEAEQIAAEWSQSRPWSQAGGTAIPSCHNAQRQRHGQRQRRLSDPSVSSSAKVFAFADPEETSGCPRQAKFHDVPRGNLWAIDESNGQFITVQRSQPGNAAIRSAGVTTTRLRI